MLELAKEERGSEDLFFGDEASLASPRVRSIAEGKKASMRSSMVESEVSDNAAESDEDPNLPKTKSRRALALKVTCSVRM